MSTTHAAVMGDRGRIVVPSDLRSRQGWSQGDRLLLIETSDGVVLTSCEQAKALVRAQLQGANLVGALLAERRAAAADEDVA